MRLERVWKRNYRLCRGTFHIRYPRWWMLSRVVEVGYPGYLPNQRWGKGQERYEGIRERAWLASIPCLLGQSRKIQTRSAKSRRIEIGLRCLGWCKRNTTRTHGTTAHYPAEEEWYKRVERKEAFLLTIATGQIEEAASQPNGPEKQT